MRTELEENFWNNKYAALFGGAMNDTESIEYKETLLVGEHLASLGYIVKSGGYRGMMEAVSKGAQQNGGHTIGYTCATFPSTKGNDYLSETVVCDDLFHRLKMLISNTDLFIVQKGGIGTFAELLLCLDIVRKIKKDRPKVILIGEFWNDIMNPMKNMMHPKEQEIFLVVKNFEKLKNVNL